MAHAAQAYTITLTLEELRAIKRVACHLARGYAEHRKVVHIAVDNVHEYTTIIAKISHAVAQQVLRDDTTVME